MEILRDEYLDYMTFRGARRPLLVELFGPLVGLEEEWREQGATEEEINLTAFGFDYVRRHGVRVATGLIHPCTEEVIENTPEFLIKRDRYGRRVKLSKAAATIPLPMEYPVSDMDSWREFRHHYEFSEDRFADGWAEQAREARERDALIVAHIPGGFDEVRQLMGEEQACLACYEQPELVHDILNTIGRTAERVLERVVSEVQVDQFSVHEDMAGKGGPLWGPRQVREFVLPYYRRAWDLLAAHGARLFSQDSDGNMNPVIDAFLDCGVNCMYPMEPAAGMDIVEVRKKYDDRLATLGGIDKHVVRHSRGAIRKELEYKLQPMMRGGGSVFGLDHRIPNGTPIDLYRYYVRTAREILGLDPDPEPGWARMAF
ncbi:MAG: uroporphyrinogen decarboxylase family protein [Candidatus Brocadiia bacterium]